MPVELLVGAAVGAAAASPGIRKAARRGLIYGLGSALIAYDKAMALAHGAVEGARKGVASATEADAPRANGTASPTAAAQPPAGAPSA